ncbi:MAG: hypothetical protein ACE15D_13905 [Candidatus Eisenbacteria bacterium]
MSDGGAKQIESLSIDEDLSFQKKTWRAERIAWAIGALALLAALAGLFGNGPISHAVAGSRESGLWVEHEKVLRASAPATFRFHLSPDAAVDEEPEIVIGERFSELFQIDRITPEPVRTELSGRGMVYAFSLGDAEQPLTVTVDALVRRTGRFDVPAWDGAGDEVTIRLWILP